MQTSVIKLDPAKPDPAGIKHAANLIDSGALVAFPTETVYGIASALKTEPLKRLDDLKGRDRTKPYTVHIGQKSDVSKYVSRIDLRLEKLMRKAWPGPLTIVFKLTAEDIRRQRSRLDAPLFDAVCSSKSLGLRCPQNRIASQLLSWSESIVVAPSANLAGRDPACDADDVLAQLDGQVDLVLDGGPCRYKTSSTVVRLGAKGWELLRQGVYSKQDIEAMGRVNILFVCTGNT